MTEKNKTKLENILRQVGFPVQSLPYPNLTKCGNSTIQTVTTKNINAKCLMLNAEKVKDRPSDIYVLFRENESAPIGYADKSDLGYYYPDVVIRDATYRAPIEQLKQNIQYDRFKKKISLN